MSPIIISLYDGHPCLETIADELHSDIGKIVLHDFPDGESYIKFETDIVNKDIIFLNSLDKPNNKILPLILACQTARDLGAKSIGLCTPYLSYMRQDKRFNPGEGITSKYFAELLSKYFDWLVTVDPHLHRYESLSDIYTIPTQCLHATSVISDWIAEEINNPVLIGPDSESEQWVKTIANKNNLPYFILNKTRYDDYHVSISKPDLEQYKNYQPILIDDIISTGRTMIETINQLKQIKLLPPVCIGVHAVFANNAYEQLLKADVKQVITCNTISHISNTIDLSGLLSNGISVALKL